MGDRQFQDGVCALLIYLYEVFIRFLLLNMWFRSVYVDVIIVQDLGEGGSLCFL